MKRFVLVLAAAASTAMGTAASEMVAVTRLARCTHEERTVWSNNRAFTLIYQQAASDAWGDREETTNLLYTRYPSISKYCLECLGEATGCGKENCMF